LFYLTSLELHTQLALNVLFLMNSHTSNYLEKYIVPRYPTLTKARGS